MNKPQSSKINQDLIQHLFSFEQQTSKIYLAFSNNYMKNDQMLPVDGTGQNQRDRIGLQFTELEMNLASLQNYETKV